MPSQPFVLMVAGPNGSGKTTLVEELRRSGVVLGTHISPDEIAITLSGSDIARALAAQAQADSLRAHCIAQGVSFSFETVMSHESKIDILKEAKRRGFRVATYFVATESADLNVARVAQRVAQGGHNVPESKIRERYDRALRLLPLAIDVSDDVTLFDNTMGVTSAYPAILRPFLQRRGNSLVLTPPIPKWALGALGDVLTSEPNS